jgi:acetate kinase
MASPHALIVNAGSSSVKFTLYENNRILLDGVIDRIGTSTGATLEVTTGGKNTPEKDAKPVPVANHREAGMLLHELTKGYHLDLVVHRVVHGGHHTTPAVITPQFIEEIKHLAPLAPLHLPPAIAIIELFAERNHATGVACFDTMFHATMPAVAKTYAIPQALAKKYGIVRYGFHGLAHQAMAEAAARLAKRPLQQLRIITCQLGNGVSACAIKNGKSIDTSMGFTPLEGLVMGTRSGDIDPAIMPFLVDNEHLDLHACLNMLEKESGLKALAGASDVRDLLARERTDAQAKLALDLFAYKVRTRIGTYVAALDGVDIIVLGGGISRSMVMRERILRGMEYFGVRLDTKANAQKGLPLRISRGRTLVYVIDVDEQAHMLKLARKFLGKQR